jgi:CBS domain containing-hemolysin-like protein
MSEQTDKPASAVERWLERLRAKFRARGADADLRETIEEIIEEGIEESETPPAPISAQERTILRNVFKLRELTARDVMVPRADIIAVRHDVSLKDLVERMAREAHSRLPIYRETLDDVIGIVHIKDVLPFWGSNREFRLADVLRKVLFVAPSMRVLDLLLEMRRTRIHMALVVDEYGGVDGVVTIEDLVEEIVGEIEDEHDVEEGPRLVRQPDGTLFADARMTIAEFETELGPLIAADAHGDDINTLGGAVVAQAGRVPGRGEVITHPAGFEFEVLEADPRRLKRLKVRKITPPPAAEQ